MSYLRLSASERPLEFPENKEKDSVKPIFENAVVRYRLCWNIFSFVVHHNLYPRLFHLDSLIFYLH